MAGIADADEHRLIRIAVISETGDEQDLSIGDWNAHSRPHVGTAANRFVAMAFETLDFPGGSRDLLLDSAADALYRLDYDIYNPGEPAKLVLVGPLGVDTSDLAGMDIAFHTDILFATLTVNGQPGLYTLDRSTGHATLVGLIPTTPISSLTVDYVPPPIFTPIPPNDTVRWS